MYSHDQMSSWLRHRHCFDDDDSTSSETSNLGLDSWFKWSYGKYTITEYAQLHTIQNCNNLTNKKIFKCQTARATNRKSFIAADYYFIFLNLACPQGRALLNT